MEPHPQDAHKTLYKYTATITAKDPTKVQAIYDAVHRQYTTRLLPGLAQVSRSARCWLPAAISGRDSSPCACSDNALHKSKINAALST